MNPYKEPSGLMPNAFNPFKHPIYDRTWTLYDPKQERTSDRSATIQMNSLATFKGSEPQKNQRVTTNLLAVEEGLAMQISAFQIFTDYTSAEIRKGKILSDGLTGKEYTVISPYVQGKYNTIMVTEVND